MLHLHPSSGDFEFMHAFRNWLEHAAPGWRASQPILERTETGKVFLVFSLYRHGLAVALCESPEDALEKIGDTRLLEEYLQLIKGFK